MSFSIGFCEHFLKVIIELKSSFSKIDDEHENAPDSALK